MKQSVAGLLAGCGKVFVLCPHTDDEFGCAGTIARLVDAGAAVRYLALSRCEESVPAGYPADILFRECMAATRALGIAAEYVEVGSFKVRHFPRDRQDILEKLHCVSDAYRPDLVLLPSSFDMHQDHRTVFEEGFRAFKHATLLGYELPQNLISFNNTAFVALSDRYVRKKIAALSRYRSQAHRPYSNEDFVKGLARMRGVQCGAPYAEAFEAIRLVVR
ncbi:MAG: PIG-L family deacetylase [Deltaproteobacteria bacterium]|nr:PIG-L family deacetylase [Deltaproteobacteria bacterium]